MKIKEITVGLSGTIPVASYENLKPHYGMTIELLEGDNEEEAFAMARNRLREMFENEANRAKTDLIEKQYQNIRFYEVNGKKYPSVTSILGWNTEWKITEDELCQYGARGTIIHTLIEKYFKDKIWYEPTDLPELENEVNTLMSGSKGLTWKTCSYKEAIENIVKDVEVVATEQRVYNDAHLYCGRFDMLCKYKGELTLMDFKSGTTTDMRQLAAYSACLPGVKQLCIIPCGQTENKSGFKKPIICTDIQKEFKRFLHARSEFLQRFGI